MLPFRVHAGVAAPLDLPNVDTDQIIPKQFLKRVERTGFGQFLFFDWRYAPDGSADAAFVLNEPRYAEASILLAGRNFGCGSSREHAPWALLDYGFRAVIAPSFADIFRNNCTKNGVLPVELSEAEVSELMRRAREVADYRLTVDLERREVRDGRGFSATFEIDEFRRQCLLEGLDDIGLTLRHDSLIRRFEQRRPAWTESAPAPASAAEREI
ncbi:MAG TPA: 3-isopropylmalate dehydratase small subunit [Pyrinomonadaceae bacterium]|jgi:3-isopropylmalate/(R)-2-methylmalate dehydratase small subunit